MFYSHEVLTSREYGVATVWLVATLGAKSNLKKVNRKAILEVDIPKACQTITTPVAPMALRLQSNLLYGVSRVYSEKCLYVLMDAQTAQNNMRALLKVMRTAETDPNAGKARPDQLNLEDDPRFLPEFDMPDLDLDFSLIGSSTQGFSERSSGMSVRSLPSSHFSHHIDEESIKGLIIPVSESGTGGAFGSFSMRSDSAQAQRFTTTANPFDEEDGLLPDIGFNFDAEGNFIELVDVQPDAAQTAESDLHGPATRFRSDSEAAEAQLLQEYSGRVPAAEVALEGGMDIDDSLLQQDDGYRLRPSAEPFAVTGGPCQPFHKSSSESPETDETDSAEAPQVRRHRGPRLLPTDSVTQLRNSDLAAWNTNYLPNMAEASRQKQQQKLAALAKQNAMAWVYGTSIGGVINRGPFADVRSPLDVFSGERLMEALLGAQTTVAGRKRARRDEDDEPSESEERRRRLRSDDDDQVGRGVAVSDESGDMLLPQFDDTGIEVGRDAPPPLDDFSSQMPWNISASVHGSRQGSVAQGRGYNSSIGGGFATSVGGLSSTGAFPAGLTGSFDRRSSRFPITSPSPLQGRGQHRDGGLDLPGFDDEDELLGGGLRSDDPALEEFQLHGPAAAVDTQTAAESQWMKGVLDQESKNFLDYVKTEINIRKGEAEDVDQLGLDSDDTIAFDELLQPTQHTKIVAAQAFHHLLVLATKGLLQVKQDAEYGPIQMSIALGA